MIVIKNINNGKLINGDSAIQLKRIPSESIDLVVTDPPYGYSFMGKNWDKVLPDMEIFKECLRVLKPGAFAFVMAAPRQDVLSRMVIKLKEADFKTDFTSIYWTYATGFPKANNIGKTIDKRLGKEREIIGTRKQHDIRNNGYASKKSEFVEEIKGGPVSQEAKQFEGSYGGFQPKPAVEVIIVAQKPGTRKTQINQALDNGKGVTWLDDCRIPYFDGDKSSAGNRTATFGTQETISGGDGSGCWEMCKEGRFPANLLVSDDVLGDSGGYSRFFTLDAWVERNLPFLIVPKASKKEKNTGLQNREKQNNNHPTVKPIKLMSYLITMGSRKGDIVLDPFCGSGTTCLAARPLGRKFIGIEKESDFYEIAKARLRNISGVANKPENESKSSSTITAESKKVLSKTFKTHQRVYFKSCRQMTELKDSSVDFTMTSPPYYNAPSYYKGLFEDYECFCNFISQVAAEIYRVLKDGRIAAINIDDMLVDGVKYPIVADTIKLFEKVGFRYRDQIIWKKPDNYIMNSRRCGNLIQYPFPMYYYPENLCESILIFQKGQFDYRSIPQRIKELSKIDKKEFLENKWYLSCWEIENVPPGSRLEKGIAAFPEEIPYRLIKLFSHRGETVLEPFMGSGTTMKVAHELGRNSVGYEIKPELEKVIQEKIGASTFIEFEKESEDSTVRSLSEVESITLSWDKSVIDMQAVPSVIDHALNSPGKSFVYNGIAIETTFKKHQSAKPEKEPDNVQDWADKGINISRGCSNNCRYCYAREESVRRHGNTVENWPKEELRPEMINKGWRISSKRLMFPTTHDITPYTYDACQTVLKKLLKAGNKVLVVSKPRPDLIEKLCDAIAPYKSQVMFRFTITAMDNEVLGFWEPNAPTYEDRKKALTLVKEKGFRNSVSIEPMLDSLNVGDLIEDLRPHTTDCMWVGPMKMVKKRVVNDSPEVDKAIIKIISDQTSEKLLPIYTRYKDDPMIKWKGHYRKQLRKLGIKIPPQKDDWRDQL